MSTKTVFFCHILVILTGSCVFLMWVTAGNSEISTRWHFMTRFVLKIGQNRQNPLFLQKRKYLKITPKYRTHRKKVLETWNLAKLYTKIVQKEISGHFFDFWLFCQNMGRCRPKITKNREFWPAAPQISAKKSKIKKVAWNFSLYYFRVQLGQISGF